MAISGIKAKILLPAVLIVLAVAASTLLWNILQFSSFVDDETVKGVDTATDVALNALEALKAEAAAVSLGVSRDPLVVAAIEEGNRDALLARALSAQEDSGVEFCTVTDAHGRVIARTHAPEEYGDIVTSQANIRSAIYGEALTAVEEGTAVRLSVRSGTPVFNGRGEVIGVVSVGFRLDTERFVDEIKEIMGCEVTIVLGDERIATTVLGENGVRVTGTRADAHIAETVLAGNTYSGRVDILGRMAVCRYTPINGSDGRAVGMLFVGQYFDEELKTIGDFVRGGGVITAAMLALATAVLLIVVGHIVKPIRAMTKAASALAVGDTELDIPVNTKDETRTLADAFNSMIENTRRQVQTVEEIASGGLSFTLQPRSEKDLMNRALEKLNATIKAQAAAIREEHNRVKLMLDTNPLACRLWDKNYRLIECNEAAVKLFGLKDKQEYIDRYYELSPEVQPDGRTTREKAGAIVREAFEKGSCTHEWMYRMPDGTPVPAEITMMRVPYGDDHVVAAYSRDLREEKKMISEIRDTSAQLETALKEAQKANAAKSDFLASMSHEMRTPLNAIIGLSEIALGNEDMNEDVKLNLEKIYNSGSTLLSIVNDILDISKIQSGKFEIIPSSYDVPSLINDSVLQNILRIGSRPIRFVLNIDGDLPARLFGDSLRVKQIISNLLSNAFKYTEEGSVELGLSCARDGGAVWMTVRVVDTGIGIRPDHLGRLFADFEQFGATSYHQAGGTGLGLSITKSLAEMMGGTVSVESVYGKGSVFTVRLRQGRVSDDVIGSNVADSLKRFQYSVNKLDRNSRVKRVQFPYARVLLVDDNITNLDVAKGLMKPYGMRIDSVTGGTDAIRAIREEKVRYSAVFMDHMMPGIDGVEATRVIREEIGTQYAKTVPIIALTANAVAGSEEMFLNRGFQAFISKPIDIAKLDAVLLRWVRDKSLETGIDEVGNDAPEKESPMLKGVSVFGLDTAKALARFGGDELVLAGILRSYAAGTRGLLEKLHGYLESGDTENYAIAVHGIKGSSYGVCAQEAGDMAKELETAAKAGDSGAVKAGHPAFAEYMGKVLDALDGVLTDPPSEKPFADEPDPAVLRELRRASTAFDMDGVDGAMDKLESFRYGDGEELVRWLRQQVDNMAFEEISAMNIPQDTGGFTDVEGIDSDQGIRHSGSKELFLKLLRDFYKLINFKSDQIETYLAQGRISDVTTIAHALKTSAQIIGAAELADGFRKLERLGVEGNKDAMAREAPAVLARYRGFRPLLKSFAETHSRGKTEVSGKDLALTLRKLIAAADGFDLDGVDAAVERLEGLHFPAEYQALADMLGVYAADADMEDVIKLAQELLKFAETLPEGGA
ncbi:MAG: cache domain-containing protein [Oscillospiraceae bacterium]|nr:cache domain-containing protein [Oscillospiraceae bacterium]